MTTPAEAEQLIYNRFLTEWGTTTPVTLEEEKIPAAVVLGATPWVYLYVQDYDTYQQTQGRIGNRKFIRRAQVVIRIMVPQIAGTDLAITLAQQARTVFEGISLEPLKNFLASPIERVGPMPPEYIVVVRCPFEYEEIK